jgi:hypothetical protein
MSQFFWTRHKSLLDDRRKISISNKEVRLKRAAVKPVALFPPKDPAQSQGKSGFRRRSAKHATTQNIKPFKGRCIILVRIVHLSRSAAVCSHYTKSSERAIIGRVNTMRSPPHTVD